MKKSLLDTIKDNFPSGLVVFLVALPLCLGIALASGAPPLAGVISGIVGGIVVGAMSNSNISVSGPAAGLTAIVLTAITDLKAFDLFLCAGIIAGIIQLVLGFIRAGSISNYFPNNVIEGMLAGIGVIIILKQIPHAVGFDKDFEGTESLFDSGINFSYFQELYSSIQLGSLVITLISLAILIAWDKIPTLKKLKMLPGALVAVVVSIFLNEIFGKINPIFVISKEHLVSLPIPTSLSEFSNLITFPNFDGFLNAKVWVAGATIAIVASIETLLCIEAADRMDKKKRITDTNLELKAQGFGNLISAFIGGLPMTSVVVRSSANANSGATSKHSAIIHGVLLLLCVVSIPVILNKIPLATLAAVLLIVGYKLAVPNIKHFAKPMHVWVNALLILITINILVWFEISGYLTAKFIALFLLIIALSYNIYLYQGKSRFKKTFNANKTLYFPFFATVLAVYFTDLLKGVGIGLMISIYYLLQANMKKAYYFSREELKGAEEIKIELAEEVSFLNKAAIKKTIKNIMPNSKVIIDASRTVYIAHDVVEMIEEFANIRAKDEGIEVQLIGFKTSYVEFEESNDGHLKIKHKNAL